MGSLARRARRLGRGAIILAAFRAGAGRPGGRRAQPSTLAATRRPWAGRRRLRGAACVRSSSVDKKRRQEGVALAAPKPGRVADVRERRVQGPSEMTTALSTLSPTKRPSTGAIARCWRATPIPRTCSTSSHRCARGATDRLGARVSRVDRVQESHRWRPWRFVPPGHYYSPLPSRTTSRARATWCRRPRSIAGCCQPERTRATRAARTLRSPLPVGPLHRRRSAWLQVPLREPLVCVRRRHLPARDAASLPAATEFHVDRLRL